VVKVGHVNKRYCDCDTCTRLSEYSESIGLLVHKYEKSEKWDARKASTQFRHQQDGIKIASLAVQGFNRAEIAMRIGQSKDYVSKLVTEFNIGIQQK
jgi:hypothetical protein